MPSIILYRPLTVWDDSMPDFRIVPLVKEHVRYKVGVVFLTLTRSEDGTWDNEDSDDQIITSIFWDSDTNCPNSGEIRPFDGDNGIIENGEFKGKVLYGFKDTDEGPCQCGYIIHKFLDEDELEEYGDQI